MLKEICNFDNLVRGRSNFTTMSLKNVVKLEKMLQFSFMAQICLQIKTKTKNENCIVKNQIDSTIENFFICSICGLPLTCLSNWFVLISTFLTGLQIIHCKTGESGLG